LATDLIGFTHTAVRWTLYPRAFATGSSMMPNKSNPDALELLRGECNGLLGAYQQVVLTLKGLPSGYNRDLQCIKPVLHQAVSTLQTVTELVTVFVQHLDFDRERLRASLEQGDVGATLDMESLVASGMTLRDAHHARAATSGQRAVPVHHCDAYKTLGSANPQETRRVAAELLARLG
jgi:argininosuccinate lyase